MFDFINHEYDVLVATTIIESGLDIPNANTIIINDAHLFGLSDLHQIRGRVGRSNKKAFCYLLTTPVSLLTPDARKRLKAIEDFADLGSGFNIAMRDLDIRGAGNLLGSEQSGFIAEVGFEMYQKILDEAIQELKENEFKDLFKEELEEKQHHFVADCQIDTDLELLIPDSYVTNISERLLLYKELDNCKEEDDLHRFRLNLQDRFGPVPKVTEELIQTVRMRWMAEQFGIEKIVLKQKTMIAYFIQNQQSAFYSSPIFAKIIQYVNQGRLQGRLREKNNKLGIFSENVKNISQVVSMFQSLIDYVGLNNEKQTTTQKQDTL
jgi:transcription-repair coupling factor (superfamily II helicase)